MKEKDRREEVKNWMPQLISIPIGLFHLSGGEKWGCMFVSDKCMEILECSMADFLDRLMEIEVVSLMEIPEKTVGMLLEKMKRTHESGAFVGIRRNTEGSIQYIRGNLSVSLSADGRLRIYGQITDATKIKEQANYRRTIEEEKEQIYQIIARHSNRILYGYDLKSRTTSPWDKVNKEKDVLSHLYGNSYSHDEVEKNPFILPGSVEQVRKFFTAIHEGIPSGESKIHLRLKDGEPRWYHFMYSTLFSDNQPQKALISIMDITELHEQELAYLRYVQTINEGADGQLLYLESDLTDDRIDRLAGKLISSDKWDFDGSHTEFGRMVMERKFGFREAAKASAYFSCENLLNLYSRGEKQLKSEWEVSTKDGSWHWLEIETVLLGDPYNGHIKAFFSIRDFTEERKKRMDILRCAQVDGMTGLLRKSVGEERISQLLSTDRDKGGILILMDLDDLKGINDSLGHKQGDAAIIGIADALKSHFRRDDILVRCGGDEFIAFLPGAAQSAEAVETAIVSLLQKLSAIPIGEHKERTIHCSIGCAVEKEGDSYDTLFKRADTALYQVKRNGKNNYAFFDPAMLEENYRFKQSPAVFATDGSRVEKRGQ